MKNTILIAALALLFASCGFQQRKYTHGFWMGDAAHQMDQQLVTSEKRNEGVLVSRNLNDLVASSHASDNVIELSNLIEPSWVSAPFDTITPKNGNSETEEDFMPAKPNSEVSQAQKSADNTYGTAHDPCYDPYRDELSKEVADNVLWGVLSMLATSLYGIGIIAAVIFFFKSLKTHKKIKELNTNGQYKDLLKMNFAALVATGSIFSLVALFLVFFLLFAILSLVGSI